jgi:hypothetical protein
MIESPSHFLRRDGLFQYLHHRAEMRFPTNAVIASWKNRTLRISRHNPNRWGCNEVIPTFLI